MLALRVGLLLFLARGVHAAGTAVTTGCQYSCIVLSGLNCTQGPPGPQGPAGLAPDTSLYPIQNGNSLGAALALGTNDAFALTLKTSGVTRVAVPATGGLEVVGQTKTTTLQLGSTTLTSTGTAYGLALPPAPPDTGQVLTATSPTASAWVLPRQLVLAELAYGPVTLSDRTITIPATGTPAEVTGFTTDVFAGTLFDRPLSGRLRYTGTATAVFAVSWSVSCRLASSTSRRVRLHLAKNGVAVPNSYVRQLLTSTSDYNSVTSQQLVSLAPNDYVSLFVTNEGSADGVAFAQFSLLAQGVV